MMKRSDFMELKIEYLDKNSLKPYVNNAKIHTDAQIEQIKNSIEQFGFNDPIAVWKDNEIIEGHGRLLAAMQMDDISTVPVIHLDELTDSQRKAYMLAHNKLTMNTGFDFGILEQELENLLDFDMADFGFDSIDTKFDEAALDELFEDAEPKEKEPKKIQCPHCGEWFEAK
jgi:ParB-like chromosome segregation protein Spo0J